VGALCGVRPPVRALYWSTSASVVLLGVPQIVAVLALAALVLAFTSVGALS
jgi:hypothetical protein